MNRKSQMFNKENRHSNGYASSYPKRYYNRNSNYSYNSWNNSGYGYNKKPYYESSSYYQKPKELRNESTVLDYTKEDLEKENELMKKIMVVSTYKCYFAELQKLSKEESKSASFTENPEQEIIDLSQLKIDNEKVCNAVHNLLRELVPSKLLGEEVPVLVNECRKECEIPASTVEEVNDEINSQIDHYSNEFHNTRDSLLTMIIKKDTFEYERAQTNDSEYKEGKLKFLSAYRIFQRPNLNGKERQAIIREQWKQLDPNKKYIFVLRSRWDKERARFRQKTIEFKAQLAIFIQQGADCTGDGSLLKTSAQISEDTDFFSSFNFIKEEDEEEEEDFLD